MGKLTAVGAGSEDREHGAMEGQAGEGAGMWVTGIVGASGASWERL